ncbi:MAG: recombinase RecA [Spirochaetaceae bacterium]|nr:MAG: recombinase RecA [Spirochaetaceae bacterium]
MAKKESSAAIGNTDDKSRAIEAARLQIEKQFGKGSLMKLGVGAELKNIETIPSGSILLDEALGLGGYPKGRVIEIYGPESSGKTTLALHAIAEAQKKNGIAAFIDAEHALDPVYAGNLGVNIDELWVSQPDNGEQALEIAESLVRSGAVDVIVVDSVAALTPQAEIEGDMGDSHMGLQARLMSQALRKLTGTISKSGTCLIFINQIRMKIGVMFGNPETTTGGKALKFYSSVRLEVRRIETITKGSDDAIGNRVRVKVVKNKVASPFRKAELEIMFGKGISSSGSLLDAALKYDMVQKSGSWYSMGEERIGQGRENAKTFIESNPDIAADLEARLRPVMFPPPKRRDADDTAAAGNAAAAAGKPEPEVEDEPAPVRPAASRNSGDEGSEDELF